MIVVPAGITSWVSVRLGILTKVDFLLLFQESTHLLVAYLNRFCSSTQKN